MIRIMDVDTARKTILRRKQFNQKQYSANTLRTTEEYFGMGMTPPMAVEKILETVEKEGDKAVRRWSSLLDGFEGENKKVPASSLKAAWEEMPVTTKEALQLAKDRITEFHSLQPVSSWTTQKMGGKIGQRVTPINSVGVYVPGGTAPLPSSLLMSVIPAQAAGVENIIVATPPPANASILAAAYLCEIDAVFQVGGAQAIAALAFGTESVPCVNKIVGAGNLFVTLAKQQLFGLVGLDGLAGPTETMIIADDTANPDWVAADLLAQAEHDVIATAILLTPSSGIANKVQKQIPQQVKNLSRKKMIIESLNNNGGIVLTESLEQAAALANEYGAEHLCLSVKNPRELMEKINNAGGFFLGDHSFEVLGDYVAGPSHVMPTGGTARFASPLNVFDFVKISGVVSLDGATAQSISAYAAELAELEGLPAHAAAAKARMEV